MVVARKYIYVKEFDGMPTKENFQMVEEELQELKNGEYLAEAIFLSVDPYMRVFHIKTGDTMIGTQVAKIIKSKSEKFPVGKHVIGGFGWRTHTISKDNLPFIGFTSPRPLPFIGDLPLSLTLGMLGMPGNTAYFGFLEVCKPQPGETVVISGAAGAVGNHVGQIAKIMGCTVIGIVGSKQKLEWLKSLDFDYVFNYKTDDLKKAISEVASKGVDCYFDNVGGSISSVVINLMNTNGRICVCGSISSYNAKEDHPLAPFVQRLLKIKHLKMVGFNINQWIDRWDEGIAQNLKWIQEEKLKYKETITEGFENMPNAFIGLFSGENIGKAIVKV